MKIWVAYLIGIFVLASRTTSKGVRPRNLTVVIASIFVAAFLYQYRYI